SDVYTDDDEYIPTLTFRQHLLNNLESDDEDEVPKLPPPPTNFEPLVHPSLHQT
ncbi:13577_t:CDS:2, partial [Dentiscutata erythropus]